VEAPGVDDKAWMQETFESFRVMGFADDEIVDLKRILSGTTGVFFFFETSCCCLLCWPVFSLLVSSLLSYYLAHCVGILLLGNLPFQGEEKAFVSDESLLAEILDLFDLKDVLGPVRKALEAREFKSGGRSSGYSVPLSLKV
jgi:hypothetical protein